MPLITSLLIYVLYAFIIVLLVRVAFSWVSPFPTNAVSRLAFSITEPVLAPIRRLVPPVSGLDLSPLLLMLVIYFVIAALRSLGG
jgi:YggT family protein